VQHVQLRDEAEIGCGGSSLVDVFGSRH
jgi:hypothetical protein